MGIVLSVMVGPVFFSLVQGSIEHGFRFGAFMALGIFFSDLGYAIFTYFGIHILAELTYFGQILGFVGGFILIGFGIAFLLNKKRDRPNTGGLSLVSLPRKTAFGKGIAINGLNPFVLLFWVSLGSMVSLKKEWGDFSLIYFYLSLLVTVLFFDLVKVYIAKRVSNLIRPSLMSRLNKLVGLIMMGFGLRML